VVVLLEEEIVEKALERRLTQDDKDIRAKLLHALSKMAIFDTEKN